MVEKFLWINGLHFFLLDLFLRLQRGLDFSFLFGGLDDWLLGKFQFSLFLPVVKSDLFVSHKLLITVKVLILLHNNER